MYVFTFLQQLLFPRRCIQCRVFGSCICPTCIKTLPPALATPYRDHVATFSYKHPSVRGLVRAMKYYYRQHSCDPLYPSFGATITEYLAEALIVSAQPIVLIPVPLSKQKLRQRGFNQAERIAQGIIPFLPPTTAMQTNLLYRTRDTQALFSTKNKHRRAKELIGAFHVVTDNLRTDCIYVVVDDITTSGATFEAIRHAFKKTKNRPILFSALAH